LAEKHNHDELDEDEEKQKPRSHHNNRRSVDAIRDLEDKLGLPITNKNARIMNYKDKMHISKGELMKSQESAEQFVARMKEKQKEIQQTRQQILERDKYRTQTILNESAHRRKEIEEEKKQRILERIEQHKENLDTEKKNRQKRESSWKAFKEKERNTKYLHEEIEERYAKDIVMPELEKKKKQLESIRKFHKPIKKEELDEHEKNYQEKIKVEREKQRMKREKWYADIGYGVYDENRYKTKFYEKALEEGKNKAEKKRVNSQTRKRKQEKMNNYAKIVKEMHWPEVSEKKRKELQEMKELVENGSKPKFRSPKLNNKYNTSARGSSSSSDRPQEIKKPKWNFHNPMVPKPQPKKEPIKIDWLGDRRAMRQDKEKEIMNNSQSWKAIATNATLDDQAKLQLLKAKTRMLEENAHRKEQMNKIRGSTMEGTVEVNEMLIGAIESKLSLLDNII